MENENNMKSGEVKHEHNHDHSHSHGHETNTLMGVLAYLGPLVVVSYLVAKDDPFVKFHIKQGLVLFCINIILWFLMPMFFIGLWMIMRLVNLAMLVLAIIGIVNVVQKKEKELPIVGGLAKNFKF